MRKHIYLLIALLFGMNVKAQTYCYPQNTSINFAHFHIEDFATTNAIQNINNINNGNEANSPYRYFDQDTLIIERGSTFNFTTSFASSNPTYATGGFQVWIDWGQDYSFQTLSPDASDVAYASTQMLASQSGVINVPSNAVLGVTRMRIICSMMSATAANYPCNNYTDGEMEDYPVKIVAPSCTPVYNLTTQDIQPHSISISWQTVGTEPDWSLEWGMPSFIPGTNTGIDSSTVSTMLTTISNLNSATNYDIYVRANCGSTNKSSWVKITDLTPCNPIPANQLCETFENINQLGCWSSIDSNHDGVTWQIKPNVGYNGTSNSYGGNAYVMHTNSSANQNDYLCSPLITLTGNDFLSFKFRGSDMQPYHFTDPIEVFLLSDLNMNSSTVIDTILEQFIITSPIYQDTTIDLTSYTGTKYIAFHIPNGITTNTYDIFIDNVCITSCSLVPGVDATVSLCHSEDSINLNNVINRNYNYGTWYLENHQGLINDSIFDFSTLPVGTYYAKYIVQGGCMNDTTIAKIVIVNNPNAGQGQNYNACKNETVNLFITLTGTPDMTGEWYDSQNNLIVNPTIIVPNQGGQYQYSYIASNGLCSNDTAKTTIIVDPSCDLSTNNISSSKIEIFPNPTSKYIIINNSQDSQIEKVTIMNNFGQIVYTSKDSITNQMQVNISQLTDGLYTVLINTKNNIISRRLEIIK